MRKRDLQTQRAVQEIISQISYPATCTGKHLAVSKEDMIREHGTVSLSGQELFNLKYEVLRYWPEFDFNAYDVLAEDVKWVAECLLERSIKRETYKGKPLFDVLLYYQGDLEYHGRTGLAYKVLD